jgi:hypothetical protein
MKPRIYFIGVARSLTTITRQIGLSEFGDLATSRATTASLTCASVMAEKSQIAIEGRIKDRVREQVFAGPEKFLIRDHALAGGDGEGSLRIRWQR